MPIRMNVQPQTTARPPKMSTSATRYNAGVPVPKQPVVKQALARGTKINTVLKGNRVPIQKATKPKGDISITEFVVQKLLEQKWTYHDITQAIAMKWDAQTAEIWKNRISIKRCDINAGRIATKQVVELGVKLPIPRLDREGKQLYAVEQKPRQNPVKKSTASIKQQVQVLYQRPIAPIRKALPVAKKVATPVARKVVPAKKK
jgi:hypothetical protein